MARAARATQPVEVDEETGEILPPRARSENEGRSVVTFGKTEPAAFKPTKYVSVPMLEVPPGQDFYARFVDKMRVLPPLKNDKGEVIASKYKGDHCASTIEAPDGQVRLFTWNTVFRSEMDRAYPDGAYVGKWFHITRLPIKRGKDYATFAIAEVEPA